MARGRMIDKRVSMSQKLGKISDKAARMWFMIYPHLDKEGRIAFDDLEDQQAEIIPRLKSWTLKTQAAALNELADIKLITLYPSQGKIAMQFYKFKDFQTINEKREAKSKIEPPGVAPENSGVFRITPLLSLSLSLRKEGRKLILFDFITRKFLHITEKDKAGWKDAFPACDIDMELKIAREWLLANPTKKKSNYRQFIVNWLTRTQNKGGTRKGRTGLHPRAADFLKRDD